MLFGILGPFALYVSLSSSSRLLLLLLLLLLLFLLLLLLLSLLSLLLLLFISSMLSNNRSFWRLSSMFLFFFSSSGLWLVLYYNTNFSVFVDTDHPHFLFGLELLGRFITRMFVFLCSFLACFSFYALAF